VKELCVGLPNMTETAFVRAPSLHINLMLGIRRVLQPRDRGDAFLKATLSWRTPTQTERGASVTCRSVFCDFDGNLQQCFE